MSTDNQTMVQYGSYCTEEQTKKALELGAPITVFRGFTFSFPNTFMMNHDCYFAPTTEQMLGWLEEQGLAVDLRTYFEVAKGKIHHYQFTVTDATMAFTGEYNSRKGAILAAIDAALEYLLTKTV